MPGRLADATLEWVKSETGAESVAEMVPLAGGITSAMHALRLQGRGGPRECVLREMTVEPWRTFAAELLRREAATLLLLSATDVPVPALIAVDPEGARAYDPSLLMTRLVGRPRLARPDLDALAAMLVRIHRVVPSQRPRTFQLWTDPSRWVVPAWATLPATFATAFARVAASPPVSEPCFLHRDYQPGNVLFDGDRVSGVVDWVETSWGPADLDVAHCATNLALLCGADVAGRWPQRYRAAGGRLSAERTYWGLIDAVSMLPDPAKHLPAWAAAGRTDLSEELVRRRFEEHLGALLS